MADRVKVVRCTFKPFFETRVLQGYLFFWLMGSEIGKTLLFILLGMLLLYISRIKIKNYQLPAPVISTLLFFS